MELKVVRTRTTETVVTVEKEWSIEANVTIENGKIQNIEGDAVKPEYQPVRFNEYRFENGQSNRTVNGVTKETEDVYGIVAELIEAVTFKYEF